MSDVFPGAAKPAILAVLHAADHHGYRVTRMKLAKLLYLCDLEAVRSGQEPFSGVTWKWLNYGPYNYALRGIEDELVHDGAVDRTTAQNFYGSSENRLRPVASFPRIEPDRWAIIDSVVSQYGELAPTTLRDETYQTEPMLTAQAGGQRGVVLDLLEVRPVPDIGSALRRLRSVRDRLPKQDTDPGVWDDLRDDMRGLSHVRQSATTKMLGE